MGLSTCLWETSARWKGLLLESVFLPMAGRWWLSRNKRMNGVSVLKHPLGPLTYSFFSRHKLQSFSWYLVIFFERYKPLHLTFSTSFYLSHNFYIGLWRFLSLDCEFFEGNSFHGRITQSVCWWLKDEGEGSVWHDFQVSGLRNSRDGSTDLGNMGGKTCLENKEGRVISDLMNLRDVQMGNLRGSWRWMSQAQETGLAADTDLGTISI